ncbi:glycoside hydrolase family 37 protein [Atractiella rhizophila]|nr:glycoside hydrolase family 37 protein [Atractiella rhizophila]
MGRILLLSLVVGSLASALPPFDVLGVQKDFAPSATANPSGVLSSLAPAASYSPSIALPSTTASASAIIPYPRKPIPKKQPTCKSEIFCPGSPILHAVQLAQVLVDSKTFVDKPTKGSSQQVLNNWKALVGEDSGVGSDGTLNISITYAQLEQFIDDNFQGEGLDLQSTTIPDFNPNPSFLIHVKDKFLRGWGQIVHGIWRDLARENIQNTNGGFETTSIPLNRSFIIAGGRFREAYYWDSRWILEGLLTSEIYSMSKNMIENFLDVMDQVGFLPNGMRIYYLNRSQPPLMTQMVYNYIQHTNDVDILKRALPILEKEMAFFQNNRTITYTNPKSGQVHNISHYKVASTAPRPEGYLPDWLTIWGDDVKNPTFDLSEEAQDRLYIELASGAESGMDYSGAKWSKTPLANKTNNFPSLRELNIYETLPVDLNSILFRNYELLATMYKIKGETYNEKKSLAWQTKANSLKHAILDLFWDPDRLTFYDFNTTAGDHGKYWTTASFYPYWSGIWPRDLLDSPEKTSTAFKGFGYLLSRYNGSLPTTLLDTGLQWDFQDWPPHAYIYAQAVANIPKNLSESSFESWSADVNDFSVLPSNVFGVDEADLPPAPIDGTDSSFAEVRPWGQSGNVAVLNETVSWKDGLLLSMAQRYIGSAFCSWYASGGSIPGVLNRLSQEELAQTFSQNFFGNMFEKFAASTLDQAGVGGEYTVQSGFGWTNGVVIKWLEQFGDKLVTPDCPRIIIEQEEGKVAQGKWVEW